MCASLFGPRSSKDKEATKNWQLVCTLQAAFGKYDMGQMFAVFMMYGTLDIGPTTGIDLMGDHDGVYI